MDTFDTYSTTFPIRSLRKSSAVPGQSLHPAIFSTSSTVLQDNFISFLSYTKTKNIPILPVSLPDVRSVLGQGASFLVNGAEVPETHVDPDSGIVFPQGMVVAFKRAIWNEGMNDSIANRIGVIFNETLTMQHPPLLAHPNIVKLLGIGFELEGPPGHEWAMPVLIPECAARGNLAEVLETARKEDRPLAFEDKISLVIDIAHGLEILHACDIVHGDVKCENILIFERDEKQQRGGHEKFDLYCKMTDFGVSRLPTGGVILGGSRPWQAPECSRGAYFMIEAAKQTDVYSFGMLLWRVMLDGDPFQTLGEFEGKTPKDKRQQRNEAVAALKDEDSLVKHVCSSLALSENFSRSQLEMLCEVINMTLTKEPRHRELDMARLIRMLTPNNWYQRRHPVDPQRIEMDFDVQLLDIEKYYSEFKKASPVVQSRIALGYREYAEGSKAQGQDVDDENRSAAAYQLAICYAVGFGVEFQPEECLKWLRFAAGKGSQKAQESLPKIVKAFESQQDDFVNVTVNDGIDQSVFSLSSATSSYPEEEFLKPGDASGLFRPLHFGGDDGDITSGWTLLRAAEACRYDVLDALLSKSAKPGASEDGVSPIHFLSSWDVNRAEQLGQSLVRAGADVNARAKWGGSVGGTPLMWSVYGDHLMHSTILMKLGADPMAATEDGIDALSFAAQLHLTEHLRLLLENSRPAKVRGHMNRLIEAAASGESRYVRITRHTDHWKTAAIGTLQLLQSWNALFPDAVDFKKLLLPALHSSLNSAFGRMNTDVQLTFIDHNNIEPSQLTKMLRDSVVDYNRGLFEALLDRGVPVTGTFDQGKNLLHLCAKIPDHITAAAVFAPRLLALGAVLEAHDDTGLTPWMDAVLERKWDLADLYLEKGAEPLATDNDGYNVLGLTIIAINAGSIKYLLKYCAARVAFHQKSFLINPTKNISALQQAALLSLPPEHGMKIEVMGVFLLMLANFGSREQVDFRSDAFLPNATALEVAASRGNAHPVKNLTKNGAHRAAGKRAVEFARERLASTTDYLERKNLERCVFIIENWDDESKNTRKLADDWTNMRTIDDSHVRSSWELISWDYKGMKKI